MAARKLTKKQIAAGFGGKRRQQALKASRKRPASKTTRRRAAPAKSRRPRRTSTMPKFDTSSLIAGAATGLAASYAQNIPAVGRYAPAAGFVVGSMVAKDASVKKTAMYLAGLSLGSSFASQTTGQSSGGLL